MVSLVTPLPECADVVKRQKVLMNITADNMQRTFVFMIPSRFSFVIIVIDYRKNLGPSPPLPGWIDY
jgi:hypothetical protein